MKTKLKIATVSELAVILVVFVQMRNKIIYGIHLLFVLMTGVFFYLSGASNWYLMGAVAAPLIISFFPSLSGASYTINVRILFPISVGLLTVSFYHYFPNLVQDEGAANLARFGISNAGSGVSQSQFEVNPIFKDAVSVLYAICTAFLMWKGLADFDELKQVIYEEVDQVSIISDYLEYFHSSEPSEVNNEQTILKLRESLLLYLSTMLHSGKVTAAEENQEVLKQCLGSVRDLRFHDENDKVALEEIMKGLSRVSVLRSRRSVCIEKKMSPFILTIMLLMSLTMVGSFFGNATGEVSIDYLYVFLLPLFYSSIFMTLVDLSSPFDGYWSIKLAAIGAAQEKIRSHVQASGHLYPMPGEGGEHGTEKSSSGPSRLQMEDFGAV